MGLRVELDRGNERLAKQIRNAEQARVPIMAIVGEAEIESKSLSIRSRKRGDLGVIALDEVLKSLKECVDEGIEFHDKMQSA